ncbi:hypothetical protein JX266_003975 [Neoarthrinium moseri]|nr:hypothetical protein JX266_003975 [Neoarthrinium moseri]
MVKEAQQKVIDQKTRDNEIAKTLRKLTSGAEPTQREGPKEPEEKFESMASVLDRIGKEQQKQVKKTDDKRVTDRWIDEEFPVWVWEPSKKHYTPSMEEKGCIYLGEDVRGITFPANQEGVPKVLIPQVLTEIDAYMEEVEKLERKRPADAGYANEYVDLIPAQSDDGGEADADDAVSQAPDVTQGHTQEDITLHTPDLTKEVAEEGAGKAD